jgi:hypothetical protein
VRGKEIEEQVNVEVGEKPWSSEESQLLIGLAEFLLAQV